MIYPVSQILFLFCFVYRSVSGCIDYAVGLGRVYALVNAAGAAKIYFWKITGCKLDIVRARSLQLPSKLAV